MPLEKRTKFILKRGFTMMFLLRSDVLCDPVETRRADRKRAVPGLPCEIATFRGARLDPLAGNALEFFDPIRLADSASKAGEKMNMVFNAANQDGRAIELPGHPAKVGVHFPAKDVAPDKGETSFR